MQGKFNEAIYDSKAGQLVVGDRDTAARESVAAVDTPTNEKFREWIEQFVEEFGVTAPAEVLGSELCLRDFSRWIAGNSSINVARWKKFRTQKVVRVHFRSR